MNNCCVLINYVISVQGIIKVLYLIKAILKSVTFKNMSRFLPNVLQMHFYSYMIGQWGLCCTSRTIHPWFPPVAAEINALLRGNKWRIWGEPFEIEMRSGE